MIDNEEITTKIVNNKYMETNVLDLFSFIFGGVYKFYIGIIGN